jgi:HD-like signal output (HDOD) protein
MTITQLIARTRNLASFPLVFEKVNEVIDRPESSAEDIAAALETDQALSARLLRIANSAFYGFPSAVESVRQAVVILGTRQIRDLMMATLAINQFKGIAPSLVNMSDFWRHSLATALCARAFARRRREPNIERFFISGLLHDVGGLVLYQSEPTMAARALERHAETGELLHACEARVFGFDHADVGAALLSAWRFPAAIQAVVGGHHRFGVAARHAQELAVVQVADVVAHAMDLGTNGERNVPVLDSSAWDLVAEHPLDLAELLDEVDTVLREVEPLFLGRPGEPAGARA